MVWISKIVSIGTCVVMMEFVCLSLLPGRSKFLDA